MSEETPKTTAVKKEKDPKRVEAGKRLAEFNRERKMNSKNETETPQNNISYGLIINVIGIAVSLFSLYYVMNNKKESQMEHKNPETCEVKPQKVLDS